MAEPTHTVALTLVDDATGAVFARTDVPPGELPETFAVATTLHLDDGDWSVVHAEPRTRAEYSRTGTLTLRLRRVEMIDPGQLLYSLPSICDWIPGTGGGALAGDECVLNEDDWRQFELVSRAHAAESDAEIAAVRRIHDEERAAVGWRTLHVRPGPDPPIAAALTLDDVDRAFGGELSFRGVTFRGAGAPLASGFSFRTADGLECYGIAEGGRVTVLGIVQDVPNPPPTRSADSLVALARKFDLDLVHWCRCARAAWDDPLFRQLVTGDV